MERRNSKAFSGPWWFGVLCLLMASLPLQAAGAKTQAITAKNSNYLLERELESARQLGRPVLAFFHTEWCQPCHLFIRELLPRPEVQAFLGKMHWVSYDAERGPGRIAAERLGVRSYPNFVLFANDGTICGRIPGFIPDAAVWIEQIQGKLSLARDETEVKVELAKDTPGLAARLAAGRWYALRSRFDEALEQLDEAVRLGEQNNEASEEAAAAGWLRSKLRHARDVCNYRKGDPTCHARGPDLPTWRRGLVEEGVALVRRSPGARAATQAVQLAVLSGLLGDGERDELLGLVQDAVKGTGSIPLVALAAHAYDPALLLAQRGVKLAPQDASALLCLAEVYHYRGERNLALLMADKARQVDKAQDGAKRALLIDRFRKRYESAGKKGGDPSPLVESIQKRVSEQLAGPGLDPEHDL